MKNQNPVIVGLDIGTTKIAAIAGRKNHFGKLEILGFGKSDSSGVNHGMVLNIEDCINAIKEAIDNCYLNNSNLEINEVYVGIAGQHIKSLQTTGQRAIQNVEEIVQQSDVNSLIKDQNATFIPPGDEIIDIIPQDFKIDEHGPFLVKEVVGMAGRRITANFHIVTGDKNAIRNIQRCVKRSKLSIKGLELQPLASAAAVMTPEDFEMGVAIIDIGGGTTDLAVFHDGMLKHTAVIPRAGVNITDDIRKGLGVLNAQAEIMKIKYGMALANEASANAFISIPGMKGQKPKEISVKNLANIIQARMEEIFEFVQYHLIEQNLHDKLHAGVIITGGGSQLSHLVQLAEFQLGLPARIGFPNEHLAKHDEAELSKPMYATCIGLILKGYDEYENQLNISSSNILKEFVNETVEEFHSTVMDSNSINDELGKVFGNEEVKPVENNPVENYSFENSTNQLENLFEIKLPENELTSNIQSEINEPHSISEGTVVKRKNSINKIFGTIKERLLDIFEGDDDNKLD
jgi:cell division protein FtsA